MFTDDGPRTRRNQSDPYDPRWHDDEPRYPSDEEAEAFEQLMKDDSDEARAFRKRYYRDREHDLQGED